MQILEKATETHDPLGLRRFELTEAYYDLIISLKGAYFRLFFAEQHKENPDANHLKFWESKYLYFAKMSYDVDFSSFERMEKGIEELGMEYRNLEKI
jgi:hypothetical protein